MLTESEVRLVFAQGEEAVVAAFMTLQARVEALEVRLGKDSHNSHKPPSSDGPGRPPRQQSDRPSGGRQSGGQPGHPGRTLKMVATPDVVVPHQAAWCAGCGGELTTVGQVAERRQVVDVPSVKLAVTEHQAIEHTCAKCGTVSRGEFPEGVQPGAQYGSGIKAQLVYLVTEHMLPLERTAQLARDLYGAEISEGTIVNAIALCSDRLMPVTDQIKAAITAAELGHFDETSLRTNKKLAWLHNASTATLTYYSLDTHRGREAMDRIGILPKFQGIAVHDCLASYFGYACRHQICNAHLLRELIAIFEMNHQDWANQLADLLREMLHKRKTRGWLTEHQQRAFRRRYDNIIRLGRRHNPFQMATFKTGKQGQPKKTPAQNLLRRLDDHRDDVLRFLTDPKIPFDNNPAERDLRMMKVKQKVSGCFRSFDSGQAFCTIRSYTSTMRKQAHDVLTALVSVFDAHTVLPMMA